MYFGLRSRYCLYTWSPIGIGSRQFGVECLDVDCQLDNASALAVKGKEESHPHDR